MSSVTAGEGEERCRKVTGAQGRDSRTDDSFAWPLHLSQTELARLATPFTWSPDDATSQEETSSNRIARSQCRRLTTCAVQRTSTFWSIPQRVTEKLATSIFSHSDVPLPESSSPFSGLLLVVSIGILQVVDHRHRAMVFRISEETMGMASNATTRLVVPSLGRQGS
ncbi:hypothetical protein HDV57DRAFT_321895 [Trichoderma longibrachiatum]|uniref:Uncharacterized protein n=1 Tax=Trichoderma longibrachiatum ATCC 18648 TaxID=983965 RepID=A0A2T4BW75_TRILO|nr:hypothetical protein M440DRAFT_1064998 [Trichoderma longibrachiatum ATCC 18648]